jgi:outer membrane protein TolC
MKKRVLFWSNRVAGLTVALLVANAHAAEVRHLTLDQAVQLAIKQNRSLKIVRLKVEENRQKKAQDHSGYFPTITNQSNALHITELQKILVPAGGLGNVSGSLIPGAAVNLNQGKNNLFSSGTMLAQPVTQLIRIHQQNRIAAAEVATARDDVKKAENEVALQVHTLYYGILISQLQKKAAEQQSEFANESLRESEDDVRNGSALKVALIGNRAELLEGKQAELTSDLQIADYQAALNDLLGLALDTKLELDPVVPATSETVSKTEYLKIAWAENPEILAAEESVQKARAGVKAAKSAYIPDITAYARDSYQNGVPFFVHNFGEFGVHLSYDVFDFGKRRAAIREREVQLAEAEQNVDRLKDEVAVSVELSYDKFERTKSMVEVSREVVRLR